MYKRVIDYIRSFLRRSYLALPEDKVIHAQVLKLTFEQHLKDLAPSLSSSAPHCFIGYCWENEEEVSFVHQLEEHLRLAGVRTLIDYRDGQSTILGHVRKIGSREVDYVIYAMSVTVINRLHSKDKTSGVKLEIPRVLRRARKDPKSIVPLLLNGDMVRAIPEELHDIGYIDFRESEKYYFGVFDLLKRIFPKYNFNKVISEFKKEYHTINRYSKELRFKQWIQLKKLYKEEEELTKKILTQATETLFREKERELAAKKRRLFQIFSSPSQYTDRYAINLRSIVGIGSVLVLALGIFLVQRNYENITHILKHQGLSLVHQRITSSLSLPPDEVTLLRPTYIKKIEEKFKEAKNIKTVALVGVGGAGKTTLARQYARQQDAKVIWEINADTHEALRVSFENLAQALAETEEDQKILRDIQSIGDTKAREERLIQFVREYLKSHPHWILIFDNVEQFLDIQKYFPTDEKIWGKGKIILTTRDNNIKNIPYITDSIFIRELTEAEKFELFTKVLYSPSSSQYTAAQKGHIQQFLRHIPHFPLDIAIAAHYIKTTNMSYEKYLDRLKEYNKEFFALQEDILRDMGLYKKTRYSIITLSLKHLIETHKDFKELLLLISLLDSQNIPLELLDVYKGDIVTDKFIYHLRKHSYITKASLFSTRQFSSVSLHRMVQEICLSYLIETLDLSANHKPIEAISDLLTNFTKDLLKKEDILRMRLFAHHCEKFLSHDRLLGDKITSTINENLGLIYSYLGNYMKAVQHLEQALVNSKKNEGENYYKIAKINANLGNIYRESGNFKKAVDVLKTSLALYKKHITAPRIEIAQALGYLGILHRNLGDYSKARDFLEESSRMYSLLSAQNTVESAYVLSYLGTTYRDLGDYKKAKDNLEKSSAIYIKLFPKNHIKVGWVAAHLGNVYRNLGDYERARDLLEESLKIYRIHLVDNHVDLAWVLAHLGNVYQKLGNFNKAQNLLEKSLLIFKNQDSKNLPKISWVLAYLGNTYRKLGKYESARTLLEQSFAIHKELFGEDNIRTSWVGIYLGLIRLEMADYAQAKNLFEKCLKIYTQHYPNGHRKIAGLWLHLGTLYLKLSHYKKAAHYLEKSFASFKKYYGNAHIETAKALSLLGHVNVHQGHLEKAEHFLLRSLKIFERYNHPDRYRCLEFLAELYLKKSQAAASRNAEVSNSYKIKAMSYFEEALKITKDSFSEQAPQFKRIRSKLQLLRP